MTDDLTKDRSAGRGCFFAVDRRAWARVCTLGLNPAVSYLVLARGSGPDQRTTSWSVNAIEDRTNIARRRARKAIDSLVHAGLVRITKGGTRPSYYILPAHEVPSCEGYLPPDLDPIEQRVFDQIAAGQNWLSDKGGKEWGYRNPRTVASGLVRKGRALDLGQNRYAAIHYDPETASKPDWIWLPNSLIDGAGANVAPPVELVRQTLNGAALRLLIDLYHAHELASDGGIH